MGNRIRRAYAAHSRLPVTGIRLYDLDEIPSVDQALRTAPCLVPVYEMSAELMLPTSSNGAGDQRFTANFLLLVSPALGTRGLYTITPLAASCIDAYLDALADNPRLDETLDDDLTVTATAVVRYVGPEDDPANAWYAVAITHTWTFYTEG